MKIGIDFDNTIADYTGVFYNVALDLGWIPEGIGHSKSAVKKHFIDCDQEDIWTELQGIVYGKEINKAFPYDGCIEVLQHLKAAGHELLIVSHKTLYPIIGEKVNFHTAALKWLEQNGLINNPKSPLDIDKVFFNETLADKVEKIGELQCDAFIDDLSKVLNNKYFPIFTTKILFSNQRESNIKFTANNWLEIPPIISALQASQGK